MIIISQNIIIDIVQICLFMHVAMLATFIDPLSLFDLDYFHIQTTRDWNEKVQYILFKDVLFLIVTWKISAEVKKIKL